MGPAHTFLQCLDVPPSLARPLFPVLTLLVLQYRLYIFRLRFHRYTQPARQMHYLTERAKVLRYGTIYKRNYCIDFMILFTHGSHRHCSPHDPIDFTNADTANGQPTWLV